MTWICCIKVFYSNSKFEVYEIRNGFQSWASWTAKNDTQPKLSTADPKKILILRGFVPLWSFSQIQNSNVINYRLFQRVRLFHAQSADKCCPNQVGSFLSWYQCCMLPVHQFWSFWRFNTNLRKIVPVHLWNWSITTGIWNICASGSTGNVTDIAEFQFIPGYWRWRLPLLKDQSTR